jgi:hypothetical protein
MFTINRRRALVGAAARLTAGGGTVLTAGCGAASSSSQPSSATAAGEMAGMDMGPSAGASGAAAGGVNPVPTQVLGVAEWQGMKITAQAMTAVPFLIYNGTTMQEVSPPKNVSFHLMVLLNDAQSGVVIPYSSVWATITRGGKTLLDESLWPMISRYMGPHYGNDVVLDGAGSYAMSLLVSPPVSARHLEYEKVWTASHKVSFDFKWDQAA